MRDSIPERVVPALRDGTESEISHTFPVPAGAIPESIGNLTSLQGLNLRINKLSGA